MKKNIKLFINTSRQDKTIVGLTIDGKKVGKTHDSPIFTSQVLLPLIVSILKENNLTIQDVIRLEVVEGPGSYTGLRVGASVANTLGWLLGIPVNGKKNHIIMPFYE